jgi:hypothetical protein
MRLPWQEFKELPQRVHGRLKSHVRLFPVLCLIKDISYKIKNFSGYTLVYNHGPTLIERR